MGHEYSIEELVEFLRQNDAEKQQLALGYWDRTVNSLDKPCCFKLCNKIMTDFKPTNVSRYNYASKLAERSLQLLGEFANLTPDEKYEYLEFKRIVASCYRWSSQYHEAKNILEWIIAKTNSSEDLIDKHKKDLNPKVYNILGGVLKALGDYAGAINNYEKSLECNKHKYTPQRNIAEIHQILHEFKEAINIIKEARNSAIDKFIQPVENNYDNLTFRNVCSGYNLNNQNKLSFYDIFRTMGLIHRKYGVDLSKNKKKREAKLQFNKAKAIFNDIHKTVNECKLELSDELKVLYLFEYAALYFNLARSSFYNSKNIDTFLCKSDVLFQECINLYNNKSEYERFRLGELYHFKGLIAEMKDQPKPAIDYWHKSIAEKYDAQNNYYYAAPELIAKSYHKLADIEPEPEVAIDYYNKALGFYDDADLQHSMNDTSQESWREEYINCVKNYASKLFDTGKICESLKVIDKYTCRELKTIVESKKVSLDKLLIENSNDYKKLHQRSAELLALISEIKNTDYNISQNLLQDYTSNLNELKKLKQNLVREDKHLNKVLLHPQDIDVETVQKLLSDKQKILLFFENKGCLYTFVISKDKIESEINKFNDKPEDKYEKAVQKLHYLTFVKPIEKYIDIDDHLIIIPSESTNAVPWYALIDDNNSSLIDKYTFSLAPSLSILKHMFEQTVKQKSVKPAELNIFADPIFKKPRLLRLTNTGKTAAAIEKCSNTKLYKRNDATKVNLDRVLKNKDKSKLSFLIMTHGELDKNNSKLYFSDGSLDLPQIYELPLADTAHITLAACEVGGNAMGKSLSIKGVATAMIAAGCPSVIGSTKPVNEADTCLIIKKLYSSLKGGEATITATTLRECLKNLKNRQHFDVAHWAPFVIYSCE